MQTAYSAPTFYPNELFADPVLLLRLCDSVQAKAIRPSFFCTVPSPFPSSSDVFERSRNHHFIMVLPPSDEMCRYLFEKSKPQDNCGFTRHNAFILSHPGLNH